MQTTLVGFESTWGNSVGLAGRRLNRSGKDGHKGRVRALQGGRKLPPRCQILVTSPSNKELAARAHLGCAGLGSLSFFLSFSLSLSADVLQSPGASHSFIGCLARLLASYRINEARTKAQVSYAPEHWLQRERETVYASSEVLRGTIRSNARRRAKWPRM